MNRFVISIVLIAFPAFSVLGQTSPYAGMESRPIKSLSSAQVAGYLSGDGMGMALAAELNRYPGPKHVLDMSGRLGLTDVQRAKIVAIHDEMSRNAIRIGKSIVHLEAQLDRLFASGEINGELLRSMLDEIAKKQAELRFVHLDAHLRTRGVLSVEQVAAYQRARGYGQSDQTVEHWANTQR